MRPRDVMGPLGGGPLEKRGWGRGVPGNKKGVGYNFKGVGYNFKGVGYNAGYTKLGPRGWRCKTLCTYLDGTPNAALGDGYPVRPAL
jgi:hypothetical protein